MHNITLTALRLSGSALLLAVALAVPMAPTGHAQAELFPSTEVTARPDVIRWVKSFFQPYTRAQLAAADRVDAIMAQIEPAAGHGAEAPAKAEGGHGSPSATGKTEGQKSFTGKEIGTPPPLPTVTIGGQAIITKAQSLANDVADTTPDGLKTPAMLDYLTRRFNVTPYAHSPHRGDYKAPIQVIQFVDLSCGQCMPELAKIDAVLQDSSATVLLTQIHAPTAHFQDTNMPAFYGKIAARAGVFWEYRANLIQNKPADANAIFDELVKSGVTVRDARSLMLNEARRFYRELDADALLARAFGVSQPPVLFVNGIRVGEHGLPLDRLADVLNYVNARIQRGLPEPPK